MKNLPAHLALLGTNIFFAINYTAIKFLINNEFIQPFALNLVRAMVCTVLLWVLWSFKSDSTKILKSDLLRFFLCALTGVALNQLLFIKGLSLTFSIHASLLMLVTPILISFAAAWLLREKLTGLKVLGLLLGVAGAAVLILLKESSGSAKNPVLGDVLVILNAISYAFYFILVKPLMQRYNPIAILRIIFTMGLAIMLPFCLGEFSEVKWVTFTPEAWWVLALLVLPGTFLAYLFNVYGIKVLGAGTSGAYIYLQPLFAAAVALMVLHEPLSWYKGLGAILIFSGVYLATTARSTAKEV